MEMRPSNPNDYDSTYSFLCACKYTPCQKLGRRSNCALHERGSEYSLNNIDRPWAEFVIDNTIITEGVRCDRLLLIQIAETRWIQIFVELKAKDVEHAYKQLVETINNPLFKHRSNVKIVGRIASRGGYPGNNSNREVEKLKDECKKKGWDVKGIKGPEKFSDLCKGLVQSPYSHNPPKNSP